MRIVVALGGNALLKRGEKPDARNQIENVNLAAEQLAKLAKDHELVITHGNGPQVGVLDWNPHPMLVCPSPTPSIRWVQKPRA